MTAFPTDGVAPVSSAASAVAIETNYGEFAAEYRSTDRGVSVILETLTAAREYEADAVLVAVGRTRVIIRFGTTYDSPRWLTISRTW